MSQEQIPRELRHGQRVNTLLAASVHFGQQRWPVKLRNISLSGALVESEVRVGVGSSILLSRNQFRVAGDVVWERAGLFGVRFFSEINLDEWVICPHQSKDQKSNKRPECPIENIPVSVLHERLIDEIKYVARMVANTSDTLSNDAVLRLRYTKGLQELVLGEQMLREISETLKAGPSLSSIDTFVTGPMKQRLLRM